MNSLLYNIYCDESCHLPHDDSDIMVLGAMACPVDKKVEVYNEIRTIKRKYLIDSKIEVKWTKISKSKLELYQELVDYFFKSKNLFFRAVVIKNKKILNHDKYNNCDHNLWYYKMYYLLLDKFCDPYHKYRIFIDIKDTNGGPTVAKLHEVLCNNKYDFKKDIILDINQINSSRSDIMQLTDILIGSLSYYHRGFHEDPTKSVFKKNIVDRIYEKCGPALDNGTPLSKKKFNLFIWTPRGGD